jgi:hypothetical protein
MTHKSFLVIETINNGLDVLDCLTLEDINSFLNGVDLISLVSNGFSNRGNIRITLSNEVCKNSFNGSLLLGPFIDIVIQSLNFVSETDNFTIKSNEFIFSSFNVRSILANRIIVFSDSLIFSFDFSGGTFLLVLEKIIDDFDNFGDELLISLSANILSHLEENVENGLSLVRAESNEGSFVVLRDLHEDVVILLEERSVLELNNKCSSFLECFNHVVMILLVFIESS